MNKTTSAVPMFEQGRLQTILSLIQKHGFMSIHEVVGILNVSEATVRRDFDKLQEQGSIQRVRGGVMFNGEKGDYSSIGQSKELSLDKRRTIASDKKRLIARAAVAMCNEGETIIIDGGSTTFHMAEFIIPRKLKLLTNSFAFAEVLLGISPSTIILPGGQVYPESKIILNPFENDIFKDYRASKIFMGVNGISSSGVTNDDPDLIRMERAMINRADELIILADSNKFNQQGNLILCEFNRISCLITDSGVPEHIKELADKNGIRLVIA